MRDPQSRGHVVGGLVVLGHRGRRRPRKVVVQRVAKLLFLVKPDVGERLIETRDRAAVHLDVFAVAAVHPHNVGLVAVLT